MVPETDSYEGETNPFATRWVRPDAVAYQFPTGVSAPKLVARLAAQKWRGAVLGSHGSGKSTLIHTLIPVIERAGGSVRHVKLHDGQRRSPQDVALPAPGDAPGVFIVDGYEQLGWWSRWKLKSACRRTGWGLLVTSHAPCGLPELYRTEVSLALVLQLVDHILPPSDRLIQADDVARALAAHPGNVRDTLFALYDLFEQRRRAVVRRKSGAA